MADDKEQQPESLLPYDEWMEAAMRQVVARALAHVAANGLPGEHHFYLTFRTDYPGVVMPPRLRAQYPQEMTIVLQHQFWDLKMDEEAGLISVGLSFGGVPAALVIPLGAVTGFADPYVRYGLRFRAGSARPERRRATPEAEPEPSRRSRPKRRRWSASMRSAAARRRRNSQDQEHAMNAPMPRPSGFPLFADVPAWAGPHAVEAAADRRRAHRDLRRPDGAAHRPRCAERTGVPGVPRRVASAAARRIWRSCARSSTTRRRAANDRFVALDLLKNANIAAGGVLPMCQDTGTAIVFGKKGQRVWVDGDEEEALSWGVHRTYTETNLRYSQMAPLSMFEEVNTGNNLPVQFDIMAAPGEHHADEFHLMFVAKGGGSANKSFLFQETRAILSPERLLKFLDGKMRSLGTSACPPYHLAIVIGGTSAEMTLKTVKLASTRWLDTLPTVGSKAGHAIRDLEMEQKVLELSRTLGIGAQFGGKYFCHDVRVIRLPRHGASLPVGIGVSCSADRQILAKITPDGVFLEQLETDPAKYLPETTDEHLGDDAVAVDLNRPMAEIRAQLSALSGEDAADADRHDGGGARHRARQAAGAAGSRRGPARLHQEPSGVLRGPREDARPATPPAASARPRRAAWTATCRRSRRRAARW